MKRIFAKSTVVQYWQLHPETEQYLKIWFQTILKNDFKSLAEIKVAFGTASILKNGRIVFNIKGNSHRLVAHFNLANSWFTFVLLARTANTTGLMQIRFETCLN